VFSAAMGYYKNRVGKFSREDKSVWLLSRGDDGHVQIERRKTKF
jgi:hypothetical protein